MNHHKRAVEQRRRAKRAGKPRDLRGGDLRRAVRHFSGCAYCGQAFDDEHRVTFDHYIPLGAPDSPGSVAKNIVPSCPHCNNSKGDSDPIAWLTATFGADHAAAIYTRIQTYFASLKER